MHADEVDIDAQLVQRLLAIQFPKWAKLPIKQVVSAGTNNALYKLGEDMVVRLPRIESAVKHIDTERTWLPRLAPQLPVAVPLPLGLGTASEGFPWPWTIYTWLDGVNPEADHLVEPGLLAQDIADFILAMQKVELLDGPPARRGEPLQTQNLQVRQALIALEGVIDTGAATKTWKECLKLPAWYKPPVWVHGDLMPGNLLIVSNRLSAVVDFEGVGMGDPACDLIVAWNLLPANVRDDFRNTVSVDDATWERGKGWAFSMAIIQLPYYKDTNPIMAANARYVIGEVLADIMDKE